MITKNVSIYRCAGVDVAGNYSNNTKVRQLESIPSNPVVHPGSGSQADGWTSSHDMGISLNPLVYDEHHIEHLAAHDDMQNFVHEAFSPTFEWTMDANYPSSNGF